MGEIMVGEEYLLDISKELTKVWPDNKRKIIVCHGHSIPCGYMAENTLKPLDAYPQQLLGKLGERFPHGVVSVITTAIGGENSISGAQRFEKDVLSLNPDIVTIDYGRNDMMIKEEDFISSWSSMIEMAQNKGCKVILITPATDCGRVYYDEDKRYLSDERMTELIYILANKYEVAVADAHSQFAKLLECGHTVDEYMASPNHINRDGHEIVADLIMGCFPYI